MVRKNDIKIELNSPNIAKFLADPLWYPILEKKARRITVALRKTGRPVTLDRTFANDGRAAVRITVHNLGYWDFRNSIVQKALANAKIKKSSERSGQ